MKHLQIFETKNAFDTEKENLESPCVALTEDDTNIHIVVYTTINEDDLTKGDFIDLGLPSGLKWASCNLGATTPCGYGDYYMWASTSPDYMCDSRHAPYNDGSGFYTKYINADGKTVLDPEDDAAYVATNGKAHMPTKEQIQELIDNTTLEWVNCTYLGTDNAYHKVWGQKFTGPNGNSIFIPASGYRTLNLLYFQGSDCYIWSSSRYEGYPVTAWILYCSPDGYDLNENASRTNGHPVRPVSE